MLASLPQARAQEDVTTAAISTAIDRGRQWLLDHQKDGNWELVPAPSGKDVGYIGDEQGHQWGGRTALATYALLMSGESPSNPQIQQAVNFLLKAPMTGIYAVGMRAQVWNCLPRTPAIKQAIDRDIQLLTTALKTQDTAAGFYNYFADAPGGRVDHSVSQFGVLGMWALAQAGGTVPKDYWRKVDKAWRGTQKPEGGWSYGTIGQENIPTAAMTAAGLATLFIARDYIREPMPVDKALDSGVAWLTEHLEESDEKWAYYTWYGIERVGMAAGLKYFGQRDWFLEGAAVLLRGQGGEGQWTNRTFPNPVVDTSFAVLFLSRGRAPVALNKLRYHTESASTWNQRPRDVANLTRWLAKVTERQLNWQIVGLESSVGDLQEAPVLVITGEQPLNFAENHRETLRQFVWQGGLIVGNADNGSKPFADSFRKLGSQLFPKYEFTPLPQNHPIYTAEQYLATKWTMKPQVSVLTNGARVVMVLIPAADPAKSWQVADDRARPEAFELLANIYAYAEDKQRARYKGESYLVKPKPEIQATATLKVARLQYPQNWDPEPAGWPRLAAILHNENKLDLEITSVPLGEGKLAGHALAHLTGTTKFVLSDAARKELKSFLDSGGTLVIDAAGGSRDFAESAEAELTALYPDAAAKGLAEPLPPEHPVFSAGGAKLESTRYRAFARRQSIGLANVPRLRGLTLNSKTAIYYSPEDLTVGLVGMPVDGITGYDPASATELMRRIVLSVK